MASLLRIPGRRAMHRAVADARRRSAARLAAELRAARGELDAMKGEVGDIQRERAAERVDGREA
jgi:hypothetical protein